MFLFGAAVGIVASLAGVWYYLVRLFNKHIHF